MEEELRYRETLHLNDEWVVDSMENMKGLMGQVVQIPKNGTLLPDTYHYSYGDTKEGMLQRMKNAMTTTLDELWAGRDTSISLKDCLVKSISFDISLIVLSFSKDSL